MPEIQTLYPEADGDEDFQFLVGCDHTITPEVLSAFTMRFIFRGPYRRTDIDPQELVDVSTPNPQVEITDLRRKIVTCTVTGHLLVSGEYRGVLRKTDPGARATLARWRLLVRSEHAY